MSDAPSAERFVKRGLLPENLPPVLTSRRLWDPLGSSGGYLVSKACVGQLSPYNASKRGGQRRLFSIPHPVFVHDQGLFLERHWTQIEAKYAKATGSSSRPIFPSSGARASRITPHRDLPKLRLQRLSRYKFCLVTDVSRFFPSIYTHSLPWAIHSKAEAKKDPKPNSATVFGNRIDFVLRQSQDRQTIGIPVGPDASRAISEIVLSAVDASFLAKYKGKQPLYLRHVDDYWIGGNSVEECERHLQYLRASLREYELDINELKTRIVPVNRVFGETWPTEIERELKASLGLPFAPANEADVVAVLSKIVDRAIREEDDGIIRHAIRKMDENRQWGKSWDILEHFLAQCSIQFPHSLDYVARVISWRRRLALSLDVDLWVDVARLSLANATELGRDSEALWSLWLLKELGAKVPKTTVESMVRNNSALVLAYLAHMHAHGLTTFKDVGLRLWDAVEGDAFAGHYWPLTLELTHLEIKGGSLAGSKAVAALRTLHNAKASLVDWDARPAVFDEEERDEGDEPEYAIEDIGSDYEEDEDEDENEDDEVAAFDVLSGILDL